MGRYRERIACLTEETTEVQQKPKVSSFINGRYDKIEALQPGFILTFSDLQADIAAELIRRAWPAYTFNQRTAAGIRQMIRVLGGLVGSRERAEALATMPERDLDRARGAASRCYRRPRVFFEEYGDLLIAGPAWVDELMEAAGGVGMYRELRD